MPHLQDDPEDTADTAKVQQQQGSGDGNNPLLSFAAAASKQAKTESEGGRETVLPAAAGSDITPSPYGPQFRGPYHEQHHAHHLAWMQGRPIPAPPGTPYYAAGGRRLFTPSPIRHPKDSAADAKTEGKDEPTHNEEHAGYPMRLPHQAPPPHLAYSMPPYYHPAYAHPYYDEHYEMLRTKKRPQQEQASSNESPSSPNKKAKADDDDDDNNNNEKEEDEQEEDEQESSKEETTGETTKQDVKATEDDDDDKSYTTAKEEEEEDCSEKKVESKDQASVTRSSERSTDGKNKRIISPTSSIDGINTTRDDDSRTASLGERSGSFPPGAAARPYDPWGAESYAAYGTRAPGYPPYPYYPPGAMYAPPPGWPTYHPSPEPHAMYPPMYRPRAQHYAAAGAYPYSKQPGAAVEPSASTLPPKEDAQGEQDPAEAAALSPEASPQKATEQEQGKIKSVADWQKATIASGMAPSANRCVPLQEPIPSRYWGVEGEAIEKMPLPDFHRLVNYPDYLIKNYPDYLRKTRGKNSSKALQLEKNGKRHCVMCGQTRICSASSAALAPSTRVRTSHKNRADDHESSGESGGDSSETTHIIPRQNKGLCTACDVTVWVVVQSGMEIKWCKGCKNFRPWAAFGDKGMATKCCRCRDRQREKYASQKDALRSRRQAKSKGEDPHEMAAAKGLQDLMAATI